MTMILFLILAAAEISLAAVSLSASQNKAEFGKRRLAVNGIEAGIFLLMLLLPHIDLSFRFKGLLALLIIRIAIGAVLFFINRKNEKKKSAPSIVLGALGNTAMLLGALIPAFMFNDYGLRPVTGNYEVAQASAVLVDKTRTETFENDGSFREVPVHFFYPENTGDAENGSFPLVIFSHGAFGWYQSNTSTYMELASNGYVVASLDHPYHAMYTADTSGKTVIVDKKFMNDAMTIGGTEVSNTDSSRFDTEMEWIALREADMSFVIDTLKAAADGSFGESWSFVYDTEDSIRAVTDMIDTDKIGLMGHSLGGATAVTVGRRDDVAAVIDIDGTMLGEETGLENGTITVNDAPYPHPILNIDNESHHYDRLSYREHNYIYPNNVVMDNAPEAYDVYFAGAEHMDLTDLPLFSGALAKMLGSGDIDHEECIDTMNSVILGFFDHTLKGKGDFSVNERYL